MSRPRHTSGPLKGKFMSKAEVKARKTPVETYKKRKSMTPAEVEDALKKIHPSLITPIQENTFVPPLARLKKEGESVSYEPLPPPPQEHYRYRKNFPWTECIIDVAGASLLTCFLAVFFAMYGLLIYVVARYGVPKLIALAASL